MQKESLIIVGAGVAGLYLAYLLQERFEITIIEARERIGGRIFSIDGHDMGPSWVWPHHTALLHLLRELDIEIFRQYTQGDALYDAPPQPQRFDAPPSSLSFRIEGSLSKLCERLFERLNRVRFLFGERLESLELLESSVKLQTDKSLHSSNYAILTLPPRLAAEVEYFPPLPPRLMQELFKTPTWMGNSAKCVVEFKSAFWRERGLSGFVFSHIGPLGEIHDACTATQAALFGFVQLHADMQRLRSDVERQMVRLFGIEPSEIQNIYFVDWKREIFTAHATDFAPRSSHPKYGLDMSLYSSRVHFGSTEFSHEEGGYIEGAVVQSQRVAKKLLS